MVSSDLIVAVSDVIKVTAPFDAHSLCDLPLESKHEHGSGKNRHVG